MLIIVFVITGLLMIGLSIPMMRGRVSPNKWYGFRNGATLENLDIWYPANAYALAVTVIMLGSLFTTLFLSVRYANSLVNGE